MTELARGLSGILEQHTAASTNSSWHSTKVRRDYERFGAESRFPPRQGDWEESGSARNRGLTFGRSFFEHEYLRRL